MTNASASNARNKNANRKATTIDSTVSRVLSCRAGGLEFFAASDEFGFAVAAAGVDLFGALAGMGTSAFRLGTLLEQRGMAAAHAQGQAELTKRQSAARLYAISDDVLGLLGRLCATRGDAATARKFDRQGSALTPEETAWIEAAVRSLIRRVGEHDFDPAGVLARITMADLPTVLPK